MINIIDIYLLELMNSQRTVHKQLIDEEKNFHRQSMESVAKVLEGVDRQYYSVAIIGVQNSGKSTLLNHVFGTNFDVLKQMAGSRTTRGILTSVDKSQSIIILDVEGNDAMDRAEEQDYEKMVATYALVTANVLIINIWSKSLGQYTGSQYETLKVIMQICIDQFKQQSPKTILYCVRDFNPDYDDEGEIRRKIIRDVNDIWRKLEKSEEMHAYDNKPEKLFNIEVCVLSRYREGKQGKFDEDCANLRQKFTNPKSDGYIFSHQKAQHNLPINDLPVLSQTSWQTIKQNKKLNLPSEKEQLANFRCSAIMNEVEIKFSSEIKQYEEKRKSTDFGKMKQKFLTMYDKEAYHYGKNVVEAKRAQLVTGIDDHLKKTVNVQIQWEINELASKFVDNAKKCSAETKVSTSLEEKLKDLINNYIEMLVAYMRQMNYDIPDRKKKIEQLTLKLNESFKETKTSILKLSAEQFQKQSSRTVRLLATQIIKNHFGQNFWVDAWSRFNTTMGSLIENYRTKYQWITGQELNPVEYDLLEQKITQQFKDSVKSELEKTFTNRMLDYFMKLFNHDEDGDRINFHIKTEEQIGNHFDVTRDKVILLISKLNLCNRSSIKRASLIEGMDDDASFFESTWLSNTTEHIDKSMRNQYEKTIRRKKEGQMNTVPVWLYLVIFFFVYDDLWFSAEESPILHYTFVGILLLVTLLIAIGQGKILKQFVRIVTDKLKDHFEFLR